MRDRITGYLALLCFALALLLPLALLLAAGVGWIGWDVRAGMIAAGIALVLCFVLGIALVLRVRAPTWLEILAPFLAGIAYSAANLIPFPVDDALAAVAGAVVSYLLTLRRYAAAPRWIIAPPLAAALYTLVGEFVPGPVDELAVGLAAAIVSSVAAGRSRWRSRVVAATRGGRQREGAELAVKAPDSQDGGRK